MNHGLRSYSLFIFLSAVKISSAQTQTYDLNHLYDVSTLKSDLRVLQNKLEKIHPAFYRYSNKSTFDNFFDSLSSLIERPMNERQFLSHVSLLNSKIKDGHTMFLLSERAMDYDKFKGIFFPFTIFYSESRLYITENCSSECSMVPGSEILKINGVVTSAVMQELLSRQIHDGNNQTYPLWILNQYFSSYYSFCFGQPRQFDIEIRNAKGDINQKQVRALTKDRIRHFRSSRYPGTSDGQGIVLDEKQKTAILTIRTFDDELLKSVYKQDYKQVFDSVFKHLKQQGISNLILDLRDNQGGDFAPARYLQSYLINKPSRFLMNGREARLIIPRANSFRGSLFVLINGGSFSATAIVIANLKRDKRAVFIGEETGGNKTVISGDAIEVVMPGTKLRTYISTTNFRISAGTNDGDGVLPNFYVLPDISSVLNQSDTAMAVALKLQLNR